MNTQRIYKFPANVLSADTAADNSFMKLTNCTRCKNYLLHTGEIVMCMHTEDRVIERMLGNNLRKEEIVRGCPLDPPVVKH